MFSSLNTGSTDLRDTEVQQPNTTATLSLVISSRAFSANSGQFEAGSTTTASSFLPSTPPFLFCSSIRKRIGVLQRGFADGHGAGERVQDADLDGVVGGFRAGENAAQAQNQAGGRRQPAAAAQRRYIVSKLSKHEMSSP